YRESKVGAGGEIEIFAVLVENRIQRVAHAVGDLKAFTFLQRIDKYCVQMAGKLLGVCNPLAVGRPVLPELRSFVKVSIDQLGRSACHIDEPQVQTLIAVSDFFTVG